MSVRAGQGHVRVNMEHKEGWRIALAHLDYHREDELGDFALDLKLQPHVPTFLVQMDPHHIHEPDEPGVNEATGHIPITNKPFLQGGEAYA